MMYLLMLLLFIEPDPLIIESESMKSYLNRFFANEVKCDYYDSQHTYGLYILWDDDKQHALITFGSLGENPIHNRNTVKGIAYYRGHKIYVKRGYNSQIDKVYEMLFTIDKNKSVNFNYDQESEHLYSIDMYAYETFKYDLYEFKSLGSTHDFVCK